MTAVGGEGSDPASSAGVYGCMLTTNLTAGASRTPGRPR